MILYFCVVGEASGFPRAGSHPIGPAANTLTEHPRASLQGAPVEEEAHS